MERSGTGHRLADGQNNPPRSASWRVAVDETAIQIGPEWRWCYAAIDLDSMLVLDIEVFGRRGTDPVATPLTVNERHDRSEAKLLVDSFGYRTALSQLGLSGQVEYRDRKPHRAMVSDAQTADRPFLYDLER